MSPKNLPTIPRFILFIFPISLKKKVDCCLSTSWCWRFIFSGINLADGISRGRLTDCWLHNYSALQGWKATIPGGVWNFISGAIIDAADGAWKTLTMTALICYNTKVQATTGEDLRLGES